MKTPEIIDLLIEKIRKDYLEDIALVYLYGSFLYDDFHALSDIDLFLIPATERGNNLGATFILKGIGYDFWTVSWEWVERVAAYEERSPSLITEGQVAYYRSEDDLARFTGLQERARAVDREKYLKKALESMGEVYKTAFLIDASADMAEIRMGTIDFIYKLSAVLSQVNGTSIKRQRGHLKAEILAMKNIPPAFEENYETLFTGRDIGEIKRAVAYLTAETKRILHEQEGPGGGISFKDGFEGWYEEMVQHYNKIYRACDTGDYYTALFAGVELTAELDEMFKRTGVSPGLPDMVEAYKPGDLAGMKEAAREHQKKLERLLAENGVGIRRFKDLGELKIFLEKL
jgi:hypothetical protein